MRQLLHQSKALTVIAGLK